MRSSCEKQEESLSLSRKSSPVWISGSDRGAKGSIHKLTARGQQDESKVEDFFIVEKGGRLRLITDDSAILEKIPREFRAVRIYADADPTVLRYIENLASTLPEAN